MKITERVCLCVVSLDIKAELSSDFPPQPMTLAVSNKEQVQNTTNELTYDNAVLDNESTLRKER